MSRALSVIAEVPTTGRQPESVKLDELPGGHAGGAIRQRETLWFADPPGFGIRYYPSGRRIFIAQTRMGGRSRTITLGSAFLITESEARRLARQVLLRAQTGGVPADDRQAVRRAPSFADFLNEYWRCVEPTWKPSTQRTHRAYRRGYLDGAFKGKCVDEITQADVLAWFNTVTGRAGPGGANRAFEILKAMFGRAEAWGYRPDGANPCRGIRANARRKMERFLSAQELGRLGQALEVERALYPVHVAAVELILLSGCRASEILGLHWSDIRGQRLKLRDSKTGPRIVWIGAEGKSVLDGVPKRRGVEWVFYNPATRAPIGKLEYIWERIRKRAGFAGLRLHDLRHTYASHAASLSETLPMIAKLLGHTEISSTAHYTHLDDADVQQAAEKIGTALEALLVF